MSEINIDELAEKLSKRLDDKLEEKVNELWIPAKQHYHEHEDMKKVVNFYLAVKKLGFYAFAGLVVTGLLAIAVFGLVNGTEIKVVKENLEILRPH